MYMYLSFSMSPRRGQEGRKNLERKQDAEPQEGVKIRKACINLVGIICPQGSDRVHSKKSARGVSTPSTLHPPPHPAPTALRTIWREKRFHHGKMAQSHIAPKIYIRRHHLHSQCGHSYSKEITRNCLRKKLEIRSYSHRSKFEIQSSF